METNENLTQIEKEATDAAIHWAKTDIGYFTMEAAVNRYIEATGMNQAAGMNPDAIKLGRRSSALRININAIHALDCVEEQKLHAMLIKIADEGVQQTSQRHLRL